MAEAFLKTDLSPGASFFMMARLRTSEERNTMQGWIELTVNGTRQRATDVSCGVTLLDFLRTLGLGSIYPPRGPENPGSDIVLMLDLNAAGRTVYRTICGSLMPLPLAAGREFLTLEALMQANPPHPVTELVRRRVPSLPAEAQSGIYLAFLEAWYRNDLESTQQVIDGYSGFCIRFGGFSRLREAALDLYDRVSAIHSKNKPGGSSGSPQTLAELRRLFGQEHREDLYGDTFSPALLKEIGAPPPIHYIDPAGNRFYRPETISEVHRLRLEYPHSVLVHSGIAGLSSGRPEGSACSISLESIAELRVTLEHDDYMEIGAGVSLTGLEEVLRGPLPDIAELIGRVAARPIRNRITLGEHLGNPQRIPLLALPLYLSNAKIRVVTTDGEQDVSISGFFRTRAETGLKQHELIKSVLIPKQDHAETHRFSRCYVFGTGRVRRPVLGAAGFTIDVNDGTVPAARAAFVGLDRNLVLKRAADLEENIVGRNWNEDLLERGRQLLIDACNARDDRFASAGCRKRLLTNAWNRFYEDHFNCLPLYIEPRNPPPSGEDEDEENFDTESADEDNSHSASS